MRLGILVNSNRHLQDVVAITKAACAKGHEVTLFAMDAGTEFLGEPDYLALCELDNVDMSLCRHSAEERGMSVDGLSSEIVAGSQLNNAIMNSEADKVIVL